MRALRLRQRPVPEVGWVLASLLLFGLACVALAPALGDGAPLSGFVRAPSPVATPLLSAFPAPIARSTSQEATGDRALSSFNSTSFALVASGSRVCTSYAMSESPGDRACVGASQDPSAVALPNGDVGVAFSSVTTDTSDRCPGASTQTAVRVQWLETTDGGASFGSPDDVSNTSCVFEQATEPAFADTADGTVVGAFVQYNSTTASPSPAGGTWEPPWNFGTRQDATLGLVRSVTNGSRWSAPITLWAAGRGVARPTIATFGSSVYIAYDALNLTAEVPTAGGQEPANGSAYSVDLLYSNDRGVTWNGPYALPGLNATEANASMSPALAVARNGTVAVAYVTDRACGPTPCRATDAARFTDDVVVASSASNGTRWEGPWTVATGLLEDQCYGDPAQSPWSPLSCYRYLFEFDPSPAIAFVGARMVVAYSGATFDATDSAGPTAVFAASSSDGGRLWGVSTIATSGVGDEYYSVSLAAANGTEYLLYSDENASNCSGTPCNPLDQSYSEWLAMGTSNGTEWAPPELLDISDPPEGEASVGLDWTGWSSSVVVDPSTGEPLAIYALPNGYNVSLASDAAGTYAGTNYSWSSGLTASYPDEGAKTSVNFTESGLSAGSRWGIAIDGEPFSTSDSSLTVAGVPVDRALLVIAIAPQRAEVRYSGNVSGSGAFRTFSGPATVPVSFAVSYALNLTLRPTLCTWDGFDVSFWADGRSYVDECDPAKVSPAMPWYLPANTSIRLDPTLTELFYPIYWAYWAGVGNGSYTGTDLDANLTLSGPINETLSAGPYGTGNVSIRPLGLPAGAEVRLTADGVPYAAPASGPIVLPNVSDGPIQLTNVTANATAPGWEYFGCTSCSPTVLVPFEQAMNLSFALVELDAPPVNTTLLAEGLPGGDPWQIQVNGTWFSSDGPSISLPLPNGSYPYALPGLTASNGSVAYAPSSPDGWLNASSGAVDEIPFTEAYRVEAVAGIGGSTSGPRTEWVASGTQLEFNATSDAGYQFAGWTGNGSGSYSGPDPEIVVVAGGPIVEEAAFVPLPAAHFNATFTARGVGPGTGWAVFVDGVGYSSNGSEVNVPDLLSCSAGAAGIYNLSVPIAYNGTDDARDVPGGYPSTFCIDGAYQRTVSFTAEYQVAVAATPGGAAFVADAAGLSNLSAWVATTALAGLEATPLGNSTFVGWNGTGPGAYSGPAADPSFSVEGAVQELAVYEPPPPQVTPRYNVTLLAEGLPNGTAWAVSVGGIGYASNTSEINVSGLTDGSYPLVVPSPTASGGLSRYLARSPPPSVVVTGPTRVPIDFSTEYWVVVEASPGGSTSPAGGGWYARGQALSLVALPSPGDRFVGWTANGGFRNGSGYAGIDEAPAAFEVLGPLSEYAQFAPTTPTAAASSPWGPPAGWIAFALAGAAAGSVAALLALRRRFRGPSSGTERHPRGGADVPASGGSPTIPPEPPAGLADRSGYPRSGASGARGGRRSARIGPLAGCLILLALSASPALAVLGAPTTARLPAPSLTAFVDRSSAGAPAAPLASGPLPPSPGSSIYLANATMPFPNQTGNATCVPAARSTAFAGCFNESVDPSIVALPTTSGPAHLALAYTTLTNATPCPELADATTSAVAFTTSTNGGTSWGSPSYLGPTNCSAPNALFPDAYQPSLAVLPNGTLVLAYVQFNLTTPSSSPEALVPEVMCTDTPYDRIVLTESYDDGSTWTPPTVLVNGSNPGRSLPCKNGGLPTRPSLAVYGNDDLYVAYAAVSLPLYSHAWMYVGTTNYLFWGISQDFVLASTDGGANWSAPTKLTGLLGGNAPSGGGVIQYSSPPTASVAPSGTLLVAYTTSVNITDTSCADTDGQYECVEPTFANLFVARSSNNSSSFAYENLGRIDLLPTYLVGGYAPFANDSVEPTLPEISFSPQDDGLAYLTYTAWATGWYCPTPQFGGSYGDLDCGIWPEPEVYVRNSTDNGSTFGAPVPIAPELLDPHNGSGAALDTPSLSVDANGTVYVQFGFVNGSLCLGAPVSALVTGPCAPRQEYLTWSTDDGGSFAPPVPLLERPFTGTSIDGTIHAAWYYGESSALVVADGNVFAAFAQEECYGAANRTPCIYGDGSNGAVGASELVVASFYEGPTVTLNFTETGLPSGVNWTVAVDGNARSGVAGATLSFAGVPEGPDVRFTLPWANRSYGVAYAPTGPGGGRFLANRSIRIAYSERLLVSIRSDPPASPWLFTYLGQPAGTLGYVAYSTLLFSPAPPTANWVVPGSYVNVTAAVVNYSSCSGCFIYNISFLAWTGEGNGSRSTVSPYISLRPTSGPIIETADLEVLGYCAQNGPIACAMLRVDLDFNESGLPTGTPWSVAIGYGNSTDRDNASLRESGTGPQLKFVALPLPVTFEAYAVPASGGEVYEPSSPVASPVMNFPAGAVPITYSAMDPDAGRFAVNVTAEGLPAAERFSLSLGGTNTSGIGSAVVDVPGGAPLTVSGAPVVLENGTEYVPTNLTLVPYEMDANWTNLTLPGAIEVNSSARLVVDYALAYRLTVVGNGGGTTSPPSAWVRAGGTVVLNATSSTGYSFVGWGGYGPGASTGAEALDDPLDITPRGAVTEVATFAAIPSPSWNVTFIASGLPAGTPFALSWGDRSFEGLGAVRIPSIAGDTYRLVAGPVGSNATNGTRFVVASVAGTLPEDRSGAWTVDGNGTIWINYSRQYEVLVLASGGGTTTPAPGVYWEAPNATLAISADPGSRTRFLGWNGTGDGAASTDGRTVTLQVEGPVSEAAGFALLPVAAPPRFALTVEEFGLPEGTAWSVDVGPQGGASSTSSIGTELENGSYPVAVPAVPGPEGVRWWASLPSGSVWAVQGNTTETVTFSEQFLLAVAVSAGGSVSSGGWFDSGSLVTITAGGPAASTFAGWVGSGNGSVNSTDPTISLRLTGPTNETAWYLPSTAESPARSSGVGLEGALTLFAGAAVGAAVLVYLGTRPPAGGGGRESASETAGDDRGTTDSPPVGKAPQRFPDEGEVSRT